MTIDDFNHTIYDVVKDQLGPLEGVNIGIEFKDIPNLTQSRQETSDEDMVSPVMGKCCRRKSFLGDDGHKRRIAVGFTREKI